MFVIGPVSFYVARFLLGAAEAGFFPGIIFYLTHWFPTAYRARAIAILYVAVPVALPFTPLAIPVAIIVPAVPAAVVHRRWRRTVGVHDGRRRLPAH